MRVGVHLEAYSNSNTYNSVAMETTHTTFKYCPVYWPGFGAINRCQRAPDVGILHEHKRQILDGDG